MRLLILFFAAFVAATSASAQEKRAPELVAFDTAMQLAASMACTTPPPGYTNHLWRVSVLVQARVDKDGIAKTNYVGKSLCDWYKKGFNNPIHMRWSKPVAAPIPEGDTRAPILVVFDRGVQLTVPHACPDRLRLPGFGRLKSAKFRLQATLEPDGLLRTNWKYEGTCDWHPLVTGTR